MRCLTLRNSKTRLLVDDAHGIGVMGEEGRGSASQQGVKPELLIVTFGKGVGVSGAAVLCSESVADYLLQFARHLIYSTSMPPAQAVALSASLEVIRGEEGLNGARVWQNIFSVSVRVWIGFLSKAPIRRAPSSPLSWGKQPCARAGTNAARTGNVGHGHPSAHRAAGYGASALTLTAAHKAEDIDALLEALHVASQ